jgi:hypothetical protein
MIGTWKSTSETSGSVTQTIQIIDVTRESFIGTKTSEINDGSHAKITISISVVSGEPDCICTMEKFYTKKDRKTGSGMIVLHVHRQIK